MVWGGGEKSERGSFLCGVAVLRWRAKRAVFLWWAGYCERAKRAVFLQELKKYGVTTVVRVCEATYDAAQVEKEGIQVLVSA